VVQLKREEIEMRKGASSKDDLGNEAEIDRAWLGAFLREVDAKQRYCRALASEFLEGIPKGGFPDHGRRKARSPKVGVGRYVPNLDPTAWREVKPYRAFEELTDADTFWAEAATKGLEEEEVETPLDIPTVRGHRTGLAWRHRRLQTGDYVLGPQRSSPAMASSPFPSVPAGRRSIPSTVLSLMR